MKSPFTNWSLRNRLVLGIVLLSTLGFVASGFAAQQSLKTYLLKQVDDQLNSVVGGSFARVQESGVAREHSGRENHDDEENAPRTVPKSPLAAVPTSTSLTLLDTNGNVVGAIGGDLNAAEITDYVGGLTSSDVAAYGDRPFTVEIPGSDFRVVARVLPADAGSIIVAQDLSSMDETLSHLTSLFFLIGLIVILLIALASRQVIRISLQPLTNVEDTAEKIAEGNLSVRLPDAKPKTEVGRLVNTLNSMLTRIEESFAAKQASENKLRRFVADASHELRTPLTAIRGFAELHRQGAVTGEKETKELIGRIENESKRMGGLVEDLLSLARLDQSPEMKKLPVDLVSVVEDAIESARAAGPSHPITFEKPREDIYTLGDEARIYQCVANLLANARTHTPNGTSIRVEISQDEKYSRVKVSDNGPGLTEEDQEKIFERFYRADPSRVRNGGEGSGLGLSIVDSVMRAHGGRVSVSSEVGKGATFTLEFPIEG